ncbi:MAG TPA: hypothetical protein VGV61_14980 [Thermoanaerobaculia bacterium]|jgi:hypothetical protein|nr:hypothetical protein [Thermoanaerobaculia bacterium]
MKAILLTLLLAAAPENDLARQVGLARELIEDAAIRYDDEGLRLGRERAALLAADAEASGTAPLARDAHYLVALAVWAQLYTGNNDPATLRRLAVEGIRHADHAAALDVRFADALVLSAAIRASAFMLGPIPPEVRAAMRERLRSAVKLDALAPPVAFFDALARSINPVGPAPPAGIQAYRDLVQRLDARHAHESVRPGPWDVEAHAWYAIVRLATERPEVAAIRADMARLLAMRPDAALAQELAARVEHRSWVAASAVGGLAWLALGDDPAGDGAQPAAPDVRSLALAHDARRLWFRLTFERDLPPAFGVNLVIDRDGDSAGDVPWWGRGSSFHFDRLVTAWVTREEDGYFGTVGVTDGEGAMASRYAKLASDVLLRPGEDARSLLVGVPAAALDLGAEAKVVAAGGTNLLWSDDLTADGGEGIALPPQRAASPTPARRASAMKAAS